VLEVASVIGVAGVGALWKMAVEHGSMKRGMDAILSEVRLLRSELQKDIHLLEDDLRDHEVRIRKLEQGSLPTGKG
jgi:uncharacterized oligopeptide transporter (OPT) family protein